jgi:hypothetical protein
VLYVLKLSHGKWYVGLTTRDGVLRSAGRWARQVAKRGSCRKTAWRFRI